jgi:hypothetical protein
MADEVRSRPQDHRVWVKVLKSFLAVEPPGKQNGKGDFIELDAPPVGFAVNPEIL